MSFFLSPIKKLFFHSSILLSMALCSGSLAYGQYGKNPAQDRILGKLKIYAEKNGSEKVYLQTDKDFYANGETIWFKAYLVDGITHTRSSKSKVVHVELLDDRDSIITQRRLFVEETGAAGDIQIDKKAPQGTYTLRAYTRYMLNEKDPLIFEKQIPIWEQGVAQEPIPEDLNLAKTPDEALTPKGRLKPRFFPEGGHLVAGLPNTLAFEIKDSQGNYVSTEGKIIDQDGAIVSYFQSFDFGLGALRFLPESGKRYYATFQQRGREERFPLPIPLEKGYVLNIQNNGDYLMLAISTTIQDGLNGAWLLGHLRGDTFLERNIENPAGKDTIRFRLPTTDLSEGVAHFTLFSPLGEPLCERLVFLNPDNKALVTINTSKKEPHFRSRLEMNLAMTDSQKRPLKGELSMSVYASPQLKRSSGTHNIKSWLLLNSDLGGTVPNPNYFFEDNSSSRKRQLDVLMLTHGWRKFVWKEFTKDSTVKMSTYAPEKGIMICGKTTFSANPYKPLPTHLKLSIMGNGIYQEKQGTNAQGKFSFGPLVFQDSVFVILEAMAKNQKKPKDVGIHIDSVSPTIPMPRTRKNHRAHMTTLTAGRALRESGKNKILDFKYDPDVTVLNEVTVTGKKKTRQELINEEIDRMTLHQKPRSRIFIDSLVGFELASVLDVLRLSPNVRVFGVYPNQRVIIGGFNSLTQPPDPLFLLDGVPINLQDASTMMANEVMFIDVLKRAETAIYGIRGGHGVIALYSKDTKLSRFKPQKMLPGVTNFNLKGFYKAREFYVPDYSEEKREHERPDYRTTLHWEPNIPLNSGGKATVDFFTGDIPGEYLIRVEGITEDGRPVSGMSRITVEGDGSKL